MPAPSLRSTLRIYGLKLDASRAGNHRPCNPCGHCGSLWPAGFRWRRLWDAAKQGVIADSLADRMRKIVGFLNIAVHDYQTLDPDVLHSIVEHHLEDLRVFAQAIIERFKVA